MDFFCKGCNNFLKKIIIKDGEIKRGWERVEVNGKVYRKCICGFLNETSDSQEPHPKNSEPLGNNSNGSIYFFKFHFVLM